MPPIERRRETREPKIHKLADKLTEILIYFIILFSPWAFGTTEIWSIWTMNISTYLLGVILAIKWIIRHVNRPKSVIKKKSLETNKENNPHLIIQKKFRFLLAITMGMLIVYILLSAINARASFNPETKEYIYYNFNKNIPHSYDSNATWFLFWQYLGLAILFWSVRDWLFNDYNSCYNKLINPRLKKLIFLICINGSALALECILQRIYYGDSRGKLLFLIETFYNPTNISQFGPFTYRSNAASYLNLILPLSLGLFIQLYKQSFNNPQKKTGASAEIILIPCIIITSISPIISSSRAGAFILLFQLIGFILILFLRRKFKYFRFSISLLLLICLVLGYYTGWSNIAPRIENIFTDNLSNRLEIYEMTIQMIKEYGIFGSGPGTFEAVIQFELNDTKSWPSWAHNDFLEFYLTFGKVGSFILAMLISFWLAGVYFSNKQTKSSDILLTFAYISFFSLFLNAIIDFPLQTYSIMSLACLCSAAFSTNRLQLKN